MTRLRTIGLVALVLGAGAALTDRPASGMIDVGALARAVEREEDHVTALELGDWIKNKRPNLRIIDLRSQPEFDSLHIPGAQQLSLDTLTRAHFGTGETIVLYSEGGAHSAQAWVFLRAMGLSNVYFLKGGVHEWLEDVLFPGLVEDATDAERERFKRQSALSRYFGGAPRVGVTREERATSVAQARRRGC